MSWQNGSVCGSPMQSLLSKQKTQTYKSFQLLTFELILNVTIIYVLAKRECMRVTNAVSVIQTKNPNIQVIPIVDLWADPQCNNYLCVGKSLLHPCMRHWIQNRLSFEMSRFVTEISLHSMTPLRSTSLRSTQLFTPNRLTQYLKVSSNPQKLRYKQMEIFINASNIHPQITLIFLNAVSFYNLFKTFCIMKLLIDIPVCTVLSNKKCAG